MSTDPITRRVEAALCAIAAGKFVVVADNAERENEGDLILAAEKATPAALAFLVRHTGGMQSEPPEPAFGRGNGRGSGGG